jgi:hypothetical protein
MMAKKTGSDNTAKGTGTPTKGKTTKKVDTQALPRPKAQTKIVKILVPSDHDKEFDDKVTVEFTEGARITGATVTVVFCHEETNDEETVPATERSTPEQGIYDATVPGTVSSGELYTVIAVATKLSPTPVIQSKVHRRCKKV